MALVLKNENLAPWLEKLAGSHRLIAPVDVNGKMLFRPVESPAQVVLDYANTLMSPKEWFFPQTDTMLKLKLEDPDVIDLTSTIDETPQVIVGIRPCDARAVKVLDQVFLSAPVDSYYEARGWTPEGLIPEAKLRELGLEDLAPVLARLTESAAR